MAQYPILSEILDEFYPQLGGSERDEVDNLMIETGKKMGLLVFSRTESILICLGSVIGGILFMVLCAFACRKCCCEGRNPQNQTIEFHSGADYYPNTRQQYGNPIST